MSKRPITAVVLNGGASSRFGCDKSRVMLDGISVLNRTVRAVAGVTPHCVVIGRPDPTVTHATSMPDPFPTSGPLLAIVSAFSAFAGHDLLVLPCDLPRITTAHLAMLCAPLPPGFFARAVLQNGEPTPIPSFYAAEAAPTFAHFAATGRHALRGPLLALTPTYLLADDFIAAGLDPRGLVDFDTPADLAELI